MRPPDKLGPATCAIETVSWSFELPSIRWSRWTSWGRYDWYATSKKTVKIPTTNWMTRSCQIVSARCVAGNEDALAAHPVDPGARRQREEDERQEAEDGEQREHDRARVKCD